MNRATWLTVLGLVLASLAGCRPVRYEPPHLVLSGAREMVPLLKDVGKRFEAEHVGIRIDVQARTADLAIVDVRQGLADIGLVSRPLRADETSLHAVPVAYDGIALVVHRSNPVSTLTDEQITGLFLRAYNNWAQLGGRPLPVTLVGHAEGQALRDVVLDRFFLKTTQVIPDQIVASSAHALQAVALRPSAISYASLGQAEAAVASGLPVRLLARGGVPATLANLARGAYPLSRPLNLVTRQPPQGLLADFIEFACAPEQGDLVKQYGYVSPGKREKAAR